MFSFYVYDQECVFMASLVQNIKIHSLSVKLLPKLIRKRKVQCWCSLFPFSSGNTLFGYVWSKKKKSKLSVYAEIWHLDYVEYAEFNGLVHFFCFRQKILFWGKFNLKKRQISQFKLKFVT